MTEIILTTPAITVAVGLVVLGATQIAQRFWLDPATELIKVLGRTPASRGSIEQRKCAAELLSSL